MPPEKNKMTRLERAKQFLPFNSLKGFYDLILEQEKIVTARKTLSSDEMERLSRIISNLSVGMLAKIQYYLVDGYVEKIGQITKIDPVYKTLNVVDETIPINDIIDCLVIS